MTLRKTPIISSLLLCVSWLMGQTIQTIKGRILDEEARPMPFANVVVLSRADSSLIKGVVTKDDGTFSISHDGSNNIVRISSIGYKTIYASTIEGMLGDVSMQLESTLLDKVVVRASIPKAKIKGASVIVNVENTILSRMGNGDDVLRRIPTVVKTNSGYEVLGKGTPLIYINGRMVHNNYDISILQSDQIKSIEVIQNPGARYSATAGAVIVIKTKRAVGQRLGLEASTKLQQSKGFYDDNMLNLTWSKDKLELFANLYGYYKEADSHTNYIESINSSPKWMIDNEATWREYSTYLSGKVGFSYQLENGSFGLSSGNSHFRTNGNTKSILNMIRDLSSYDKLGTYNKNKGKTWPSHLVNGYYTGSVGKVSIDANVDYLARRANLSGSTEENSRMGDDRLVSTDSRKDSRMIAEKLVIGIPVLGGWLNIGEEALYSTRRDKYVNANGYIPNNDSKTSEVTVAPFVEFSRTLGKWDLTAGLRYEYNVADYYINGVRQEGVSRLYHQLFPSFSASTSWGNNQLAISYSTKTNRPHYGQLSGNIEYQSRLLYSSGNNQLKPSISHNLGMMFMRDAFTFVLSYGYVRNDIQEALDSYQGNDQIMLSTYANYHHRNKFSFDIGWNTDIGPWIPSYNIALYSQWFATSYDNIKYTYNKPTVEFYGNNTFNLPSGWVFNLDYSFRSRGHYGTIL